MTYFILISRKGFYAGIVQGPDMCIAVPDGCQAIFVLKTNNKTDCFTRRPVQPNQITLNLNGRSNGQTVTRFVMDLPNIGQGGLSQSFSRHITANDMPSERLQELLSNIRSGNSPRQLAPNMPSENFISKRQFISYVNAPRENFVTVPSENLVTRHRFVSNVPSDNFETTRQFVSNVPNENVVTNRQFVTRSSSNIPAGAEKAIREYIR